MYRFFLFFFYISILLSNCVHSTNIKKGPDGRIIGGVVANRFQFPFMAAITKITKTGQFFCGGALITDQWILTAGQCVDNATMFDIRLGNTNLKKDDSYTVRVSSDTYILHTDYNAMTLDNDIGLIYLRESVQFSDYLSPISFLPTENQENQVLARAMGWGQISDEDPGVVDDLHWTYVTILSTSECRITYGNQITDNMLCALGSYNEGTCIGDTGSPLVRLIGMSNSEIHGISSFVSFNGCESTDPSGFTRVYKYVDWIKSTTGKKE